MPVVNPLARELVFKVVYYGPGLGGKTSSLQYIHRASKPEHRGRMVSLATPVDRTLYFDFLPIRVPNIRSLSVRLQLFTVPGQVYYNATRRLVLTGADGVVFVADSQQARAEANLESMENLRENLRQHGRSLQEVPHVLQYNKRDLPELENIEALEETLNWYGVPSFATIATGGEGVFESLEAITRAVMEDFERRAPEQSSASSRFEVPEGGLAAALRSAEAEPQPTVAEIRHTAPVRASSSGEFRLDADEPSDIWGRAVASPILVEPSLPVDPPRTQSEDTDSHGVSSQAGEQVERSGTLRPAAGGILLGQRPPRASPSETSTGEPTSVFDSEGGRREPSIQSRSSGTLSVGDDQSDAQSARAQGWGGEELALAASNEAERSVSTHGVGGDSGVSSEASRGENPLDSVALRKAEIEPESAASTQPGLGSRPRSLSKGYASEAGESFGGGVQGSVVRVGVGSPAVIDEPAGGLSVEMVGDSTRPVLPEPAPPTAPSPPSEVIAPVPRIPPLVGMSPIVQNGDARPAEGRVSSAPPGLALSFSELWPGAERSAAAEVEQKLAENEWRAAALLVADLVQRDLETFGETLVPKGQPPRRDTDVLCLLLGISAPRYLEFRLLLSRASDSRLPVDKREALEAYLFALDIRRAICRASLP